MRREIEWERKVHIKKVIERENGNGQRQSSIIPCVTVMRFIFLRIIVIRIFLYAF